MSRLTRKTVVQAKLETAYGTDPGGWAGTDAVLVSNPSVTLGQDEESRELVRGYLGASDSLITARRIEIGFEVELAGSGAAGTAPAWGRLLRACGMAETVTAGSHVEYTPVSTGFESLTIRYVVDGVVHLALGCRGTATFRLDAFARPVIAFSFTGLDGGATAATATGSYGGWKSPLPTVPSSGTRILMGASYVTASGTLSGGTATPLRSLEVDLGLTVAHTKLLGAERVDITDRAVTGKLSVELAAGDEVAWINAARTGTLTSVGYEHGNAAGNIVRLHAGSVQRKSPAVEDYEGNVLLATDLVCLPVSGDDEITVVAA